MSFKKEEDSITGKGNPTCNHGLYPFWDWKSKEERIISSESATERKVYYGIAKEIVEKHKGANPWLNWDVLNNYKRLKTNIKPVSSITIHSNPDALSDKTNSSSVPANEK